MTSYSNYGMSLAGHVVEEVSGMPYERYVEENVTVPLGMDSTTAAQPPAPALREKLATGYEIEGGEPVAGPFEYIDEAPAGSVSTTATDMARFMIAHLQDGRYGEARILDEATAQADAREAIRQRPAPGRDGPRLLRADHERRADDPARGQPHPIPRSAALLPEQDVGIFVAYNSYGEGGDFAEYELLGRSSTATTREAPTADPEPSAEGASGNAGRVAGNYRSTRSNQSAFEKVFTLASPASVTANEDGSITTSGVLTREDFTGASSDGSRSGRCVPRGGGRRAHGLPSQDGEGRVTYMSSDADPTSSFEKLPFYETANLHLGLLTGGLVVLVSRPWRGRPGR